MRILIGIDDTDNLESRGTGHRVRQLAKSLAEAGLANPEGITRHQLLVDPRIPYTSHNSSACLVAQVTETDFSAMAAHCREYLLAESADGSDTGLCIAPWQVVETELAIHQFGRKAKNVVLFRDEAKEIARRRGILLEGLTGDGGGIIGALAAVGLRFEGNDGRYLWLRGLRELEEGIFTIEDLFTNTGIEEVRSLDGTVVPSGARLDVGPWPRPILRDGRAILLVEEAEGNGNCEWKCASKDFIKRY